MTGFTLTETMMVIGAEGEASVTGTGVATNGVGTGMLALIGARFRVTLIDIWRTDNNSVSYSAVLLYRLDAREGM